MPISLTDPALITNYHRMIDELDYTLERPVGTTLYAWTLVVDGCDTGNILFNGPTTVTSAMPVPTLSEWATVGLLTMLMLAGLARLRSRRR